MEARGEHTLSEKFGGHFAAAVSAVLCLELFGNNGACWVYLFGEHTGPVECFFSCFAVFVFSFFLRLAFFCV